MNPLTDVTPKFFSELLKLNRAFVREPEMSHDSATGGLTFNRPLRAWISRPAKGAGSTAS